MEGVLRRHYEQLWGLPSREAEFRKEDNAVRVLKWDADARTGDVVLYATLGASARPAAGRSETHRLEYFLGLLPQQDDAAATLALLGPVTWSEPMGDGHTVEVEGVLWPGTTMNCWLLAEPQEPTVPPLQHDGLQVQWLQAVPLYPSERTWKAVHGAEALWTRWQSDLVPFWDPHRADWNTGISADSRAKVTRRSLLRVPTEPPVPTDPQAEAARGRMALWLDVDDLRWLARNCACDDDTSDADRDRCGRVRFRASAALHKAGVS